jgi:hypothetical protein
MIGDYFVVFVYRRGRYKGTGERIRVRDIDDYGVGEIG